MPGELPPFGVSLEEFDSLDQLTPRDSSILRGDPVRRVPQKPDNQSFILPSTPKDRRSTISQAFGADTSDQLGGL